MDWVRLNVFQRLIHQWESLHPYNAAQVMRLSGEVDLVHLQSTWDNTLNDLRMERVETDPDRYRWRMRKPNQGPTKLIEVPHGSSLDQFMSEQLNLPFDPADEQPFRPFVIAHDGSYELGVVYHHWVADSYSIRMLLREWFLRLHDLTKARRKPFEAPEAGYLGLFGPGPAAWSVADSMLTMVRWGTRFGKARRIGSKKFTELQTDFTLHRGPEGLIDGVTEAAKRMGVTVNDMFLAAMGLVCQELLPLDGTIWRRELALGTIVDLRSRRWRRHSATFGLFLGFTTVFCRPEELADPLRLIGAVNKQIRMQKQAHSAEASMIRMLGALGFARLFSRESLLEFYRKRFGMTAGISNVNLNRDWPAQYGPSPLMEYIRVSPCGPLMPVVFTPTTLGGRLDVGVSCRRSLIPEGGIGRLAERFIEHLVRFSQSPVTVFAD